MIQSYEDKHHFWYQNSPFVLNKSFLSQTIVITFIYLLSFFIVQNLKKFLLRIQNYDDAPFLGSKWSIWPPTTKIKIFFLENYYYHSHLPISLFHCAKLKTNSFSRSRVMRMCNFGPKMAHFPKWEFFQKTGLWALFPLFVPIYMPKIKVRH